MKKIAVWKVILLSIVTLGIYTIVWFAKRRDELVSTYKLNIPHWLWLVLTVILTPIVLIPIMFVLGFVAVANPGLGVMLFFIVPVVLVSIPFTITVWWVARFSVGMSQAVGGRIPAMWATLLYFFWGPALPAVQQFYINRFAGKKLPSKTVNPSPLFVGLSILAIIISGCMTVYSFSTIPNDYKTFQQDASQFKHDLQKADDLRRHADQLEREYGDCMNNVNNSDYADDATYDRAYDACEDIRTQQHKAIDELKNHEKY